MSKKKKTFRKFINEQVLGVKQKEKQFDKFEDFVKDVKGIKPPENKAASFQEFINEARGYEFDNDSVDKFDKMVIESKIEREQQKLEERKTRIDPNPIVLTNEQIEEMNRRRIIEEINEVLKHRDPVLVKMSFQQWLNIPHNKFVFELDEYQAKRLYEQDMSRVEKYEELKKKSGKGRNKVAVTSTEPTFDPKTIASLLAWYDAADTSTITFNGDLVSQWDDKSGNGHHATQGTETNQPKYFSSGGGIGQAHIRWGHDGGWNHLNAPSMNWGVVSGGGRRNASFFIVFNVSGIGDPGSWYGDFLRTSTDTIAVGGLNNAGTNDSYGTIFFRAGWQATSGTATSALPSKVLGGWLYTDSGYVTRINGSVDDTDSTLTPGSSATQSIKFGGKHSGVWTDFEISEILIFNTELTGDDLANVESYLNNKWSIY